tara:strand:- start:506 stop:1234 length:729 start_codon:yes stop_codon:yes gene_type:complete
MKTYGLIGEKLGHSFSKNFFEEKFKRSGILNTSYLNFELDHINELIGLLNTKSISGLNVTIPYKESVIPYLNALSKEAKAIGAVNTIVFKSGKLIGHNTDHIGFKNSIKPFLENTMDRALILGSGGASKAVVYALESIGLDCLVVSRTPKKDELSYKDINEFVLKHHLLIVNTTPLGTAPNINECPKIPYAFITKKHLVVDLIYNPCESLFLKKAKAQKAEILNGQSMLIHQAEEAWSLWNS